ncbi:hypothetical protein P3T36_002977 [Kitasatospora sp. MAP12-15]|uniref:hypothetical protein n=1 Tax=unclassified Kitasatospora TaxID=2633591 RepID=UPI0024752CF2|nr:hypothetical protein [Kitasatospora sp. MAP12-44]MDH6108846.1 hypothetical protein [Kitasatospora sp. MAP12-44]
MANRNKAKGTAWESAVRDFLNQRLGLLNDAGVFADPFSALNIRRPAQEGAADVGDVWAVPFVLECKDVASPAVPTFLRQARVEAMHAGYPYGVAVLKTRGKGTAFGRVCFDVPTWTRARLMLNLNSREMCGSYGFTLSTRGLDTGRWYFTVRLSDFARLLVDLRAAFGFTTFGYFL